MDNGRNIFFSNSSHLEWKAGLSDTIVKGTHPRTIPARLGVIWFSVSEEKFTTYGRTDDDGLWPGELANYFI
jgi:hypothetical protein